MCKIAGGYKRNLGHWFSEVHVDKRRQQRDQNLRWELLRPLPVYPGITQITRVSVYPGITQMRITHLGKQG